ARIYPDSQVYDPFCGSGTLLIESALQAFSIAPGINRNFAAERFDSLDSSVWSRERARAKDLIKYNKDFMARGFDIDSSAVELTLRNAKLAGVLESVKAEKRDLSAFKRETERGLVLTNPPYGERLLEIHAAEELYKAMGRLFEPVPKWKYCVISPHEKFETLFGRKADKRRKLYNGMIKCQLYLYFKVNL
ncbi:MAG TPA: RNA methyltransferase, partial [Ruminococcaceae bacterium]|nr:RNA methyltransferase [Oscillospiraceae bacterium]